MPVFVEKPALLSLYVEILPDKHRDFIDWQAEMNDSIASWPDFVSLEFTAPEEEENRWIIVQRFANAQALQNWEKGRPYNDLIERLAAMCSGSIKTDRELEASGGKSVTEVIVAEVSPGMEERFRAWTSKIHHSEAKFAGFRGVYVQPPTKAQKYCITLLQFDTPGHLDAWLQSHERSEMLKQSSGLFSSLETHRVISPYAGWFASIAKTGRIPAAWKQTMLVLLVLFPIVVLELKYLSPLTAGFDSSIATFIGNALSVSLISYPFMPLVSRLLGWWLSSDNRQTNTSGACLVISLYLIEIIFFWYAGWP